MSSRKNKLEDRTTAKKEEPMDQSESQDDDTKSKKGRLDNSLSVLTRKFVELIKNSPNRTLDLNTAVNTLTVQKRRIYDITNVLEGMGYVQKIQKNTIRWTGQSSQQDNEKSIQECMQKIALLNEQQKRLDFEINKLKNEIKQEYLDNQAMKPSQYITYQDCLEIAKSLSTDSAPKKLVILSAPKGSVLEAIEEADGSSQLTMNSNKKGEIKVYIADPETNQVIQYKG